MVQECYGRGINLTLEHKFISYPFDGLKMIFPYFFPKFTDVYIYGTAANDYLIAPNLVQDYFPLEHFAGFRSEEGQ